MLKLKLQYFGHLMRRVDSLEKTLMLGGIGGEGDDRGWDGWMASPTRWTWVCVNSRSWLWTGRLGVLRFMGLQRVRHEFVKFGQIWQRTLKLYVKNYEILLKEINRNLNKWSETSNLHGLEDSVMLIFLFSSNWFADWTRWTLNSSRCFHICLKDASKIYMEIKMTYYSCNNSEKISK